MELDWGEADPNYFFGRLMGLCVEVNGSDVWVDVVSRAGLDVSDWDEERQQGIAGTSRHIPWDEVTRLFVY